MTVSLGRTREQLAAEPFTPHAGRLLHHLRERVTKVALTSQRQQKTGNIGIRKARFMNQNSPLSARFGKAALRSEGQNSFTTHSGAKQASGGRA
jgi:hypothetical protein